MRARAAGGVPDAPRGRRGWRGQAHRLLRAARQLHHRDGEARAMQGPVRFYHRKGSSGGTTCEKLFPSGETTCEMLQSSAALQPPEDGCSATQE